MQESCKYKGIETVREHRILDRIQKLLSKPPKYHVSSVLGNLISRSALIILETRMSLK